MSIAIVANGTLFKIGASASPGTYTTIPEVSKLAGPGNKFDILDVTSHDSPGGFREFIPGLSDGDNVTATIHWKPSNAVHKDIRVASYARSVRAFQTIFPDATDNTVTYPGFTTNIMPTADIGVVLEAAITVKVTGLPVWA